MLREKLAWAGTGGGGISTGELGTGRGAYARGGDELGREELGPVVSASLELLWTWTERLLCAAGAKGSDEECWVIAGETAIASDEDTEAEARGAGCPPCIERSQFNSLLGLDDLG